MMGMFANTQRRPFGAVSGALTRLIEGFCRNTPVQRGLAFLFPGECVLCGKTLRVDALYGVCGPCLREARAAFPPAEARGRCAGCGRPLISEEGVCMSCRRRGPTASDRVFSLFPYGGKYKPLLSAYKFGARRETGAFFAECLVRSVPLFGETDALVPVPPRHGKIKASGWDQIEWLMRIVERGRPASVPPVSRCLERLPSESQKALNRAGRASNLRGKIRVKAGVPRRALLVDDVYTTGATMHECAAALKAAGSESVNGLCLF
ncbi:MAG: ComF family protein, partial [Treponema sp.]|nr:ComF family protein [Treponema sp.]